MAIEVAEALLGLGISEAVQFKPRTLLGEPGIEAKAQRCRSTWLPTHEQTAQLAVADPEGNGASRLAICL